MKAKCGCFDRAPGPGLGRKLFGREKPPRLGQEGEKNIHRAATETDPLAATPEIHFRAPRFGA